MSVNIVRGKAGDGGFILDGGIHITLRELEALAAIAEGYDNEEAAKRLGINYTTFRNHAYNIMKKLGAENRTEALVRAVENEMIYIRTKGESPESMSPGNYFVCAYCGRAFNWSNVSMAHHKPFTVNHVKYQPPDTPRCPYNDCKGNAADAFSWDDVREYHHEYPRTPESYVKYSVDRLIDAMVKSRRASKGK